MFMKTKFVLVLALALASKVSMAQFNLGIKGGVNMTKIAGKSFSEEFRTGYHLGGFAEIGLGSKFSIQPEVIFNQFNTRVDRSFSDVYQNAVNLSSYKDVKLSYLTIPLLLNFKPTKVVSLQAGPQYGILMSQDKNLLQNGQSAFKSGEFSMVGGVQLNLAALRLSGRYFVGLNNVSDISNQENWKNQGFQLSVGFKIL
jgi:hypothetical protein